MYSLNTYMQISQSVFSCIHHSQPVSACVSQCFHPYLCEFACLPLPSYSPPLSPRDYLLNFLPVTNSLQVQDCNCGKPGKDLQVKIVDDSLEEVPPYTKGEIIIKHNGIFSGYLKQPELTASATPEEGWFRPGDIGYINDEGEVFVEGRKSEVISIGPWMMHPQVCLQFCQVFLIGWWGGWLIGWLGGW